MIIGTKFKTTKRTKAHVQVQYSTAVSDGFLAVVPPNVEFEVSVWSDPIDKTVQARVLSPISDSLVPDTFKKADDLYFEFDIDFINKHTERLTDLSDCLFFYSSIKENESLSNFADYGISLGGKFYRTVEHYYQSQKFLNSDYVERIRNADSPEKARQLGSSRDFEIKYNWNEIKTDVMFHALINKISNHVEVFQRIEKSGDKLIVENSPFNDFWGIGEHKNGYNYLGILFMRCRALIHSGNLKLIRE